MIWSSVASLLNLYDLILCCFWFLCQHCWLPGSKIPRPRNRQDWFLTKTDQNSWQRTLQIVSFLSLRAHFANFTIALQTFSQNPQSAGPSIHAKRKERSLASLFSIIWLRWTTTGNFYLDNYLESLASLSSASILSDQFRWKVEAAASQILLGRYSQNVSSITISCFKGLRGSEGYVIKSF